LGVVNVSHFGLTLGLWLVLRRIVAKVDAIFGVTIAR